MHRKKGERQMDWDFQRDYLFLDRNPRFKALFLLLLRSDGYKKSEELAKELGVTSRTIKSDLKVLKEELSRLGVELSSRQSKGYQLNIRDRELEIRLKECFQIYQAETIDNEFDRRVQYILRRLLTDREPVRVESLQEELCLNVNNSISRELQRVKQVLAGYQLELVVQPHYGLRITGKEYARIACLIRMYRFFQKGSIPEFRVEAYKRLFYCTKEDRETVSKIFYKTIVKSRIVFSDIYAERFLIYLIYFRNRVLDSTVLPLEIPVLDFDFTVTEEYELVNELVEKLRNQMEGFAFSDETIRFLTFVAVMSTDLYRFRDCTEENYGSLLVLAEEARNFMLARLTEYLQINMFEDYTCMKDLLKIILPVSLKIWLEISDDVDLGFHNVTCMDHEPVLKLQMERLREAFLERYHYRFSSREMDLIFHTFLGLLNRITLSHSRLHLALIAIDGRLSTQQLKFNLQHYFSEFIEKIETRVLYELEAMESPDYDCYLCMEYGKNMNIPYRPIYYADEEMTESEYVESLSHVFFDSYRYDEVLPPIRLMEIEEQYRFEVFPIETYLNPETEYGKFSLGNKNEIIVYFSFTAPKEGVTIFSFANSEDITIRCEQYFVMIDLSVQESRQKLKMILNVIERIAESPEMIHRYCQEGLTSYKNFFIKSNASYLNQNK